RPQDAVRPAERVAEGSCPFPDALPRRQTTVQVALQEVLLPAPTRLPRGAGAAAGFLEREQASERSEGRMERGATRPLDPLAVPAAVGQLVLEEPVAEGLHLRPE